MTELEILRALDARVDWLRRPGTEQALLEHAAAFTRAAAWELRDRGWANIRKTSGTQVRGLDVDKLIHRHTLEIVDIIIAAGHHSQHVAWQDAGTGTAALIVDPQPVDAPAPAPEPPRGDVVELLEQIRDLLDTIDDKLQAVVEFQTQQGTELTRIREVLERAAAHVGI